MTRLSDGNPSKRLREAAERMLELTAGGIGYAGSDADKVKFPMGRWPKLVEAREELRAALAESNPSYRSAK